MRILIADDDLTSRAILTAILEKSGDEVVATCDGAEAWKVMEQPDAPHLAVLDWVMPGLDGVEVCRRIRARETDQPPHIIILTTRGDRASLIEGLGSGADDYLSKPYDSGELRARIDVGRRMVELRAGLADHVRDLKKALSEVQTLRGIIPICASCKNIRDDRGYWSGVESYVSEHSEAEFTHGICPECMSKLYGSPGRELRVIAP
jgi:sigma-B regulation protein RsbU (phosphoserine phosphatase)